MPFILQLKAARRQCSTGVCARPASRLQPLCPRARTRGEGPRCGLSTPGLAIIHFASLAVSRSPRKMKEFGHLAALSSLQCHISARKAIHARELLICGIFGIKKKLGTEVHGKATFAHVFYCASMVLNIVCCVPPLIYLLLFSNPAVCFFYCEISCLYDYLNSLALCTPHLLDV